jgi:hypothetical protein
LGTKTPKNDDNLAGIPFVSPGGPTLPGKLELGRALRPFMRRVPSQTHFQPDIQATVDRIADENSWLPVLKPVTTRWLDVALIVDISASMQFWQNSLTELEHLLALQGAFRKVRRWNLDTNNSATIRLQQGHTLTHNHKEILDGIGQRLIIVASDCLAPAWYSPVLTAMLKDWGKHNPLVIVQMLPTHFWKETGLGIATSGWIRPASPGSPNSQLWIDSVVSNQPTKPNPTQTMPIPVITLEPERVERWGRMVANAAEGWLPIYRLKTYKETAQKDTEEFITPNTTTAPTQLPKEPIKLLRRFRRLASPLAQRLALYLAAAPLSLPVIWLIRQALIPKARQIHLAELLINGVIKPAENNQLEQTKIHSNYYTPQYEFAPGVRQILLDSLRKDEALEIIAQASRFVTSTSGQAFDFRALLLSPETTDNTIPITKDSLPFAYVTAEVLERLGGSYSRLATQLQEKITTLRNEQKLVTPLIMGTSSIKDRLYSFIRLEKELAQNRELLKTKVTLNSYIINTGQTRQSKSSIPTKVAGEYGVDQTNDQFIPYNPTMLRTLSKSKNSPYQVIEESRIGRIETRPATDFVSVDPNITMR